MEEKYKIQYKTPTHIVVYADSPTKGNIGVCYTDGSYGIQYLEKPIIKEIIDHLDICFRLIVINVSHLDDFDMELIRISEQNKPPKAEKNGL